MEDLGAPLAFIFGGEVGQLLPEVLLYCDAGAFIPSSVGEGEEPLLRLPERSFFWGMSHAIYIYMYIAHICSICCVFVPLAYNRFSLSFLLSEAAHRTHEHGHEPTADAVDVHPLPRLRTHSCNVSVAACVVLSERFRWRYRNDSANILYRFFDLDIYSFSYYI